MTNTNKIKTLYKTIPEDKTSRGHKWRLNKWYKVDNFVGCCGSGFHGSENIIDAMSYVTPGWIALVEVRGQSDIRADKQAWEEMRVIKWKRWTQKDSISLGVFAAELVIDNYEKENPGDMRPRDAIKAAKAVLKSNTKKNRDAAARAAARAADAAYAAYAAAHAAADAAYAAADAAADAAYAARAARAARAAYAAQYEEIMQKCHNFVLERIGL